MQSVEDRFWAKVERTSGCWNWTGAKTDFGYGRFRLNGKYVLPHRYSWFLSKGVWPQEQLLHKCDNPSCVRTTHLLEGSQTDNMQDMIRKGRKSDLSGEKHGMAVLTEDDVRAIRKRYGEGGITQTQLGNEYGVWNTLISAIIRRKLWKHVE